MRRLYDSVDADYHAQLLQVTPPARRLLDVGCDDGAWTQRVAAAAGATAVAGIEIGPALEQACTRGIDARAGNLEHQWPFDDQSFDLVHANQVIEHVKRLDHFVLETRRVLAPGGAAIVCTENLASWHNIAALTLGFTPFSETNISATGPIGNPLALHQGPAGPEPWQHLHVLTLTGLRGIFTAHGFTIERVFTAGYHPVYGRAGRALARWDPRHAHFIGIVARRS
jgi:SAM-dependent methyltransferase